MGGIGEGNDRRAPQGDLIGGARGDDEQGGVLWLAHKFPFDIDGVSEVFRAPVPVFEEGQLSLQDSWACEFEEGIAPVSEFTFANVVHADIHAADVGRFTVDDDDFAVVAEVDADDVAQEEAFTVERLDVDTSLTHGADVARGKFVGTDFIVDDVDADAFGGALEEEFAECSADQVVFDDIEFDEDVFLGVFDSLVDSGVCFLGVDEQSAGITFVDREVGQLAERAEQRGAIPQVESEAFFEFLFDAVRGVVQVIVFIQVVAAYFDIAVEASRAQDEEERNSDPGEADEGNYPGDAALRRLRMQKSRT